MGTRDKRAKFDPERVPDPRQAPANWGPTRRRLGPKAQVYKAHAPLDWYDYSILYALAKKKNLSLSEMVRECIRKTGAQQGIKIELPR